jgi:hypothetical protein
VGARVGRPPHLAVAAAYDALRTAVATRSGVFADPDVARHAKLPQHPSTVARWLGRAADAEAVGGSVVDALADAPGKGRTRRPLPETLRAEIERLAGLVPSAKSSTPSRRRPRRSA